MQRINRTFGPRNAQDTAARGVVFHGVSGIGKTEIALDYAHQVNAKHLVRVFGYHPFAISLVGDYMTELQDATPQQNKVFSYMKLFGTTCSDNIDRWISLQLPAAFSLNRVTTPHSDGTPEPDGVCAALGVIHSGIAKEDGVAANILTILGFLSPATGVWPALLGHEPIEDEESAFFRSKDGKSSPSYQLARSTVVTKSEY